VVTSKCLVFISWKIPSRNERGTPTSETSISSIDHPNSRFTCTPMVPVISGFILYIVSGRYLVGGAMCPSWKIWKSMGRMTSHIWNGTSKMFETTNQFWLRCEDIWGFQMMGFTWYFLVTNSGSRHC
jgi:hypothetical protein